MWFRYDDQNPLNFAWRWQQWELQYPCPQEQRRLWPAFSPTGDAMPFTGSRASVCLETVMLAVMSAAEAAKRSWHALRITLATRLFAKRANGIARDEIEGVIQSLVRWKTPEAMRIYARMQASQYADYVDMAVNASLTPAVGIPIDMPEVDPEGVLRESEATLAAIDAEVTRAAKATRAQRDGAAIASTAPGKRPSQGARRPAPTTGKAHEGTQAQPAQHRAYDIGDGIAIQHVGDDSWGVVGQRLRMHFSFWGWSDDAYSECTVVAYAGRHTFPSGKASPHTYVIECDGHYYPATHGAVADALTDAATKRRVKKARPPKII
jgi:hypothetical protein